MLHGSHGMSARWTKSSKPEGPKAGLKGRKLENGAQWPNGTSLSSTRPSTWTLVTSAQAIWSWTALVPWVGACWLLEDLFPSCRCLPSPRAVSPLVPPWCPWVHSGYQQMWNVCNLLFFIVVSYLCHILVSLVDTMHPPTVLVVWQLYITMY